MMHTRTSDQLALLRYKDFIEQRIVNNRMTLSRWMDREEDPFPKPIRLGSNSIAWRRADVEAWLERRANAQ